MVFIQKRQDLFKIRMKKRFSQNMQIDVITERFNLQDIGTDLFIT